MSNLLEESEGTSGTNSRKRRRSANKNSSDEEDSGPDEGEYELFTKYFVSNREKTKTRPCTSKTEIATVPIEKTTTRKRKYLYKTDTVAPKKFRRFCYITESMTKPRKLKTQKSVEIEEKKTELPGKKHKSHFAKNDGSGNVYLMHRSHFKSDLFFNDEKKCNYEVSKKQDLSFYVVDEIALEGLDGITLEAFWKRLLNVFPNYINKTVADRIWRMICNNKRINFYILKEPREKLIAFDRCKYIDLDSGVFVEPFIEFKDIYPLASINGTDIRGSCSTFNTRKENNGVRKFSMEKVKKLYDQKLVFVADQTLRNKALINEETDPNIELLDLEYCLLERIGRSREQGELTQGKMSLACALKNENKNVHHNRKMLAQNFLIVNQFFYIKSFTLQQNISGGLVHLSRFYNKRKTKQVVIMEQIANLLRDRPNFQIELPEFSKIFGRSRSIIKLLKMPDFRKFFKILTFSYRKLYPNASKHEYMHKSGCKERQIKVLRMIDPYANVTAIMEAKDVKEPPAEMTSDTPGHKLMNYEYLRDIFLYILSTGTTGVTIKEIHDYFKMDFYSVRMAVRKLLLRNVIDSSKIDLGRQQSLKFFAKSAKHSEFGIETEPIIYQLNDEMTAKALQGYEEIDVPVVESKIKTETVPVQVHFDLEFDPFTCTSFLTESVDAISEELTIYDIIIKGRDKLLLIQSNLFANYISEWDDFLLKRDDFSKATQLFQSGFGKIIYDFLSTMRLSDFIEVDNCVVFSIDKVTRDTKIVSIFHGQRIVEIDHNLSNLHSDGCHFDTVTKVYLFEAMFDEDHASNQALEKLKNIFDRIMTSDGKKKRENVPAIKLEPKIQLEVANNVVMEKFMGPNPQLKHSETSDDGIKIEIYVSTEPVKFVEYGAMYTTDDVNLTQRYVNRANLILSMVYKDEIVKDVRTLFKDVRKEEDEQGYDKKVCKKSIDSIVSKLVKEGYIKVIKLVMIGKAMTRTQTFICVPYLDIEHTFIKTTIEQLKLKFYVGSVQNPKTIKVKKKIESPFSINDVKNSITELKMLTNNKLEPSYKVNKNAGKSYGYSPKFVRMRVLHEYLFYVVREFVNGEPLNNRQIFELCKSFKIKMSSNDITEMPSIYRNEISWKMFIPPLPSHNNFPKGWALACDIILRMPLSVFVKLYNITYEIPELGEFLKHPIKRHFLLKYLPVSIRNILLHKRKYFHSIYDVLCHLCYVGLLQLGPRNFKEKDQVFLYLNVKASLYDTCTSKPGYNLTEDKKYKKITFEFKSGSDIEVYWTEMLRICMNTQLGKRKILDGQCVTIEECNSKPAMMATLKAKTFEGAVEDDNGKIPGDRRGGAGLDSSLWAYVKRNWVWNAQLSNKASDDIQSQVTGLVREKFDRVLPQPIQYDLLAKGGAPERKIYLKPMKTTKKQMSVKSVVVKKASRKKIVRKIIAPKSKRVREYYDAIDQSIMKKNPLVRVEWDDEEDQLLRYCRVASVFLCPVFKKQFIPYNIIRDVLHRIYPKSKNKTARAIQRRIYLLLMSDEIVKIMESNVENFLNSELIAKYFGRIHNRYKYDIKITDAQMYVAFIYLMAYIFKHRKEIELLLLGYMATVDFFSDPYIPLFEVILQNVEDESVNLIYTNPKTAEDIEKDTIRSVIHCSMACKKNSVGWAFQLFHIYKKFPDNLIRVTVAELKKSQFLVINKNYEEKSVANNWHSPLKLSHLYNVMKSGIYPIVMYREAYRTFTKLIKTGISDEFENGFVAYNELTSFWDKTDFIFEIPEMGIILNPEIEDHSEVIDELSKRFRFYLVKIYERMNGNKNKNQEDIVALEEIKNPEKDVDEIKADVRHLIFRVPYLLEGNLELFFKKMLESSEISEINTYIYSMIVDLKQFAQENNSVDDLKDFIDAIEEQPPQDQNKLIKNLSRVVFAIQNIQIINIHLNDESSLSFEEKFKIWETERLDRENSKNDEESDSHLSRLNRNYTNGMENCIKRAQQGDFPSLDDIKEGMMAEVEDSENRTIPHITDLIMLLTEGRFPELDSDNETVEKMKEHFVMQYPKLQEFLIEDFDEFVKSEEVDLIQKPKEEIKRKAINYSIVRDPSVATEDDPDVAILPELIDFIKKREEFGVSVQELKAKFSRDCDLVKLLQFLVDRGEIVRTGISSIVYVHYEFQAKWLAETFALTAEEREIFESKEKHEMKKLKCLIEQRLKSTEPVKAQLKPWTNLDGSLNDELFNEWLCLILSRCVSFPNIPFLNLCEHFHYIKPVDIYYLLEILQELSCVEIYLYGNPEIDIFSSRSIVAESKATCLDDFEDMFVKAINVSGLCFGSFLETDIELIM